MRSEFARGLLCVSCLLGGCSREVPAERAALATREPPTGAAAPRASEQASERGETSQAAGVAVVELFTSEGCSSCPPADRVLAELAARANAGALPVYTLSFHVDYWNSLGWRDRFSSSRYSERQGNYSAISARGGVYTPQIVVNGEQECVGSNAARIDSLVDTALEHQARTRIALEATRGAHVIEVNYEVTGDTQARVLNLALVEPRADSQVERGENAGNHLTHVNVVRLFTTRALSAGTSGHWSAPAGPEFDARPVGVVAYAERAAQRDISGAAALELK